jgi:hypothetical protein
MPIRGPDWMPIDTQEDRRRQRAWLHRVPRSWPRPPPQPRSHQTRVCGGTEWRWQRCAEAYRERRASEAGGGHVSPPWLMRSAWTSAHSSNTCWTSDRPPATAHWSSNAATFPSSPTPFIISVAMSREHCYSDLREGEPGDPLGFAACGMWDRRHFYVWFRVPPGRGDVDCEPLLTGSSKC